MKTLYSIFLDLPVQVQGNGSGAEEKINAGRSAGARKSMRVDLPGKYLK